MAALEPIAAESRSRSLNSAFAGSSMLLDKLTKSSSRSSLLRPLATRYLMSRKSMMAATTDEMRVYLG